MRKYDGVLVGTVQMPEEPKLEETEAERTAREVKVDAFKIANSTGYVELLMAISDEICFGIVDEAKTDKLPGGDLDKAWKGLTDLFEPSTNATKVMLKKQFHGHKLSDAGRDPDAWITELELLRQRMKKMKIEISDEDLVIHILNNLPKEYDTLVEAIEEDLNKARTEEVTVKQVRERVRASFRRMQDRQINSDDAEEVALLVSGKKYKGRCSSCGKIGHKKEDCWENKNKKVQSEKATREDRFCGYCKRKGHTEPYCNKKKKDEREKKSKKTKDHAPEGEMVLMAHGVNDKDMICQEIWIADSGASMHATNSKEGMYDVIPCKFKITIGDGTGLKATCMGKKTLKVLQPNNKTTTITMKEVYFVPGLHCNLFSITAALTSGAKLVSEGLTLALFKEETKLVFDQMIKSPTGYVLGIKTEEAKGQAFPTVMKTPKMELNQLHQQLGHPHLVSTLETAKNYGWNVFGEWKVCEDCAMCNAKQKNVGKIAKMPSNIPGERFYMDISSVKAVSTGGSQFWCLVVDEATKMKWSFFLKEKSQVSEKVGRFLKEFKGIYHKQVRYIRCDNAGENKVLEVNCKKQGLGIIFEYTAPGTPQQNGIVERAFATLFASMRTMLKSAGLTGKQKYDLWTECANTATDLNNIVKLKSGIPYRSFHSQDTKFIQNLHVFGEEAVIKDIAHPIKGKLKDKGIKVIVVGHAKEHAGDVFRLFNPKTRKIVSSRDVIWLSKKDHKSHESRKLGK